MSVFYVKIVKIRRRLGMRPQTPIGLRRLGMISQTNNGCSFLFPYFSQASTLNISCKNIFALSIVTALTACPFLIKKCAKIRVFL